MDNYDTSELSDILANASMGQITSKIDKSPYINREEVVKFLENYNDTDIDSDVSNIEIDRQLNKLFLDSGGVFV